MRKPREIEEIRPLAAEPAKRDGGSGTLRLIGILVLVILVGLVLLNVLPSVNIGGCVGVLEISGPISASSSFNTVGTGVTLHLIETAKDRPEIKSLVVLINSPGGSVVASKEVYYALRDVNKPITAYIGEIGASGGYLAAVGADKIYADSASITGSIGARATFFDISRLLNNTGINATTVKSGPMKDIGDIYRPITEDERAVLDKMVNEIVTEFRSIVHESRNGKNNRYTFASLEKVADARILTGRQAYDLGLVDELGTKKDAIKDSAKKAGLDPDNPQVCEVKAERDLFSSLFSAMGNGIGEVLIQRLSVNDVKIS